LYIEKDSSVNEKIEQYRLAATTAVAQRRDCIIVSSISCIYGLGSPKDYHEMKIPVHRGELVVREELLLKLINIQYSRTEKDFVPGTFRVRGDKLDLWPAYSELALRIELWGNEVENLIIFTPVSQLENGFLISAKNSSLVNFVKSSKVSPISLHGPKYAPKWCIALVKFCFFTLIESELFISG
jgi:excinuclease UvrABC helicase subunit UvrB